MVVKQHIQLKRGKSRADMIACTEILKNPMNNTIIICTKSINITFLTNDSIYPIYDHPIYSVLSFATN